MPKKPTDKTKFEATRRHLRGTGTLVTEFKDACTAVGGKILNTNTALDCRLRDGQIVTGLETQGPG